jgi:polysaccharide biosynthesis PFTS motif protein
MNFKSILNSISGFNRRERGKHKELRKVLRASLDLRREGRSHEVDDMLNNFVDTKLEIDEVVLSKFLGQQGEDIISTYCAQRAYELIDTLEFRRKLLRSFGEDTYSIKYPIPREWQLALANSGFKVNNRKCDRLWFLFCLRKWCKGIFLCFEVALEPKRNDDDIVRKIDDGESWALFADLNLNCIVKKRNNSPSYNLRSWFQSYLPPDETFTASGRRLSSSACQHNGVLYSKSGLLSLRRVNQRIGFFFTSIVVAFECLLRSRGNIYQLLVFQEYAMLKKASVQLNEYLPKSIYFSNSNFLVRPLWTFLAEQRSTKVVLYFYSTNNEPFGDKAEKEWVHPGFALISWRNLMVWHDRQSAFFKSIISDDINCEVVGPIWFEDCPEQLKEDTSIDIVIFDVTPFRFSFYRTMCPPRDYYIAENGILFLEQIVTACRLLNVTPSMKFKRPLSISTLFDRRYLDAVTKMVSSGDLKLLAPEQSAQHYIKSAKMVISRPFTSTAHMAMHVSCPNVFFDPSGITSHEDESAAGVPVLTNIEELKSWIVCHI